MLTTINESLYSGRKRGSAANIILNIVLALVCLLLVAEIFFGMRYCGIYVVQHSMEYTLSGAEDLNKAGGDYIYIDTKASPDYGDIVVVYNGSQNIIKRVIAFGGDTVKIERGVVYLMKSGEEDFSPLDEPYVSADNNLPLQNNFDAHVVAEGCMFLLGDNRNVSSDSRQNGDYPLENLVGVMPSWSMSLKSFTTAVHTFFHFTLPQTFGAK